MGFFSEKLVEALFSGNYTCSECGARMEFEDEWKEVLICPKCGHEVELDRYGCESDEEYNKLYPTEAEVLGIADDEDEDDEDEDDEDYCGETYDEVCGELSDND